ncbi:hypothetical protein [Rhizobium terrae]|uniref:hypothetical protein n=1 Tax=Rhizobium terrae TaxID=2171756 RepID=UPI000E3E2368|nr:hypothetical protein [Rhizobium terrae]
MYVLLLILVPLAIFTAMFAGGAWHLRQAYRRQYVEDCFVPVFAAESAKSPRTQSGVEPGGRLRRRPPVIRAAA